MSPAIPFTFLTFLRPAGYLGFFPLTSLLSSQRAVHTIDFTSIRPEDLHKFEVQFTFRIDKTGNSYFTSYLNPELVP